MIYYIHLHGNYGCLMVLLTGNTEWTGFDIEYCQDRQDDIRKSKAVEISIEDLPESMTCSWEFRQIRERIREVYQLNPAGLEREVAG